MTVTAPVESDADAASATAPDAKPPVVRRSVAWMIEKFGLVFLFAIVLAYFGLISKGHDVFASMDNFRSILGNQSVPAIIALASIVPLLAGHFDLSLGAVLGATSIATAAALSRFDAPVVVAVFIGIALGATVGLFNGVLVAKVGVNSFITTLGVSTIIAGLVQWYTKGQSISSGIPKSLTKVGTGRWLGLPSVAFILLAVALVVWYLIEHTPFGRHVESVGSNAPAARLVGLNVDRTVVLCFVISGAMAGTAGVLTVARVSNGNPQTGPGFLLPALSAAFLGATVFKPGRFNVAGTVLAVFFVAASVSGLILSGRDPWVEDVFQGTALVFAVAISTVVSRRRARTR